MNEEIPFYPKEFDCPITQTLMIDPVFAADGHTYERSAIQHWFDIGNSRSPTSNEELPNKSLIPNHTQRKMIEKHRREVGQRYDKNGHLLLDDNLSNCSYGLVIFTNYCFANIFSALCQHVKMVHWNERRK